MLHWVYPEKCAELSGDQLKQIMTFGYRGAQRYGLANPEGTWLLAISALLLGHRFAEDPQFVWYDKILRDEQITDPGQRVTAIKEASVSHLSGWFGVKLT